MKHTQMADQRAVVRAGSELGPEDSQPDLLQWIVIVTYAGLWALTLTDLPMVGRIEKPLLVLGAVAIPLALGTSRLVTAALPPMVGIGLVGILVSYAASFLMNPPAFDGSDYVQGLAGRVFFVWIVYVLLQNRILLRQAFWLLAMSSVAVAAFAVFILFRNGIGFGRIAGNDLPDLMGPIPLALFGSVQTATIGAVLLLGATATLSGGLRRWTPIAAFTIFAAAYLSFIRREFLFTIPIVLIGLQLTAGGVTTRASLIRRSVFLVIGLVAVFGWEYSRADSVLEMRMESEIGGFVSPDEARITTSSAQVYAIMERPLLGYGAGNHAQAIAPHAPPKEIYLAGFNVYGWLAVEGGLPCLVSYLLLLLGVWQQTWRYRGVSGASAEAVVLRCGPVLVLQIVLWGTFGNAWDITLSWFVLGMILAAARLVTVSAEARVRVPGASLGPRRGARWIRR